jgi:hypothetical protein
MNSKEKTDFALYLKETQSPHGELSYLGACKLAEMVEREFNAKIGEIPAIIKGACLLARTALNPDKVQMKKDLRKGLGLLIVTAGGLSMIWGMMSAFNIWTILGVVLAIHSPVLGPLAMVAGLAVMATGISNQTPQILSRKAHGLLIEAISNWEDSHAANEKDTVARREMEEKIAACKIGPGTALAKLLTWPYRTTADFIDGPGLKPPETPPKD